MKPIRPVIVLIALVLVTAACADSSQTGEPPGATAPVSASGVPVGGGLTVREALATDTAGIIAVQGFYFDDGTGPRLCETLAESFPPQCGGASVALGGMEGVDVGTPQTDQGSMWLQDSIVIFGELVDGVLIATSLSI